MEPAAEGGEHPPDDEQGGDELADGTGHLEDRLRVLAEAEGDAEASAEGEASSDDSAE